MDQLWAHDGRVYRVVFYGRVGGAPGNYSADGNDVWDCRGGILFGYCAANLGESLAGLVWAGAIQDGLIKLEVDAVV